MAMVKSENYGGRAMMETEERERVVVVGVSDGERNKFRDKEHSRSGIWRNWNDVKLGVIWNS